MSTPPRERSLEGLCLKTTPLGEQDRLLLLLTEEEGLLKLAASLHSGFGFSALDRTAAGAKGKAQHADQANAAALPQPLAGLRHPARGQTDAGEAVMQGLLAAAFD